MKRLDLFVLVVESDVIVVAHEVEARNSCSFQQWNDLPRLVALSVFPVTSEQVSSHQKQVGLVLVGQRDQPFVNIQSTVNVRCGQNSHESCLGHCDC